MIRPIAAAVLVAFVCCGTLHGQNAATHPAFDAASVKLVDPAAPASFVTTGGPGTTDPGRIHYGHAPMIQLLMTAYGVDLDQVSGPAWVKDFMGPNFYQITATMPPGTTKEQFQSMLQNLLAERFHLTVHHETKDFPGYELVLAAGGSKMKPVPADSDEPSSVTPGPLPRMQVDQDGFPARRPGSPGSVMYSHGMVRSTNRLTMAQFAKNLGPMINESNGTAALDAPKPRVVDKTGLTGKFDFTLEFAGSGPQLPANLPLLAGRGGGDSPAPSAAGDPVGGGLTIFAALEKQLGLKLQKTKSVPLDLVVVDHVDKVPTEN